MFLVGGTLKISYAEGQPSLIMQIESEMKMKIDGKMYKFGKTIFIPRWNEIGHSMIVFLV